MKRGCALLFSLILLAVTVLPASAAAPANGRVQMANGALEAALGQDAPGAAICIVEGEGTLMLEGFGYADAEKEILVNPDTTFELGEVSGIFVAAAIYRLIALGAVDPSATLESYLPAEFYNKLGLRYPINVVQLLLGTAGFEARTFDVIFHKDSYRFSSLEEALLAEVPQQIIEPDRYSIYSPFGIALAAYVVECVSGFPYDEYVKTQILTPLEMTNTVLQPTAATRPGTMAVGYERAEVGSFAAGVRGGLSYAGLYPATGAVSTAADMERLLRFLLWGNDTVMQDATRCAMLATGFQNGALFCTYPALSSCGNAKGVQGKTLCFGASLWLNVEEGIGAVALTNVADSALLDLPLSLTKTAERDVVLSAEDHIASETLCGEYVPLGGEGRSFVGKYTATKKIVKAELNENGELSFLEMSLRQIAPGVFADASKEGDVPTVQFLMDGEGQVSAIVTADGQLYRPATLWEREVPAKILLYAMIGLTVFFLAVGVLSLLHYIICRDSENAPGFLHTLPLLFAGLTSAFALLQVFVGLQWGGRAFSSAFSALSVCTLVCSIGAIGGLLLAFVTSFARRRRTARVFRISLLYVACLLLVNYWGLTVL